MMSETNGGFDPFDPTDIIKTMRAAGMESWAKMMVQLVNSEAYAKASAAMLDAWLTSSGPFRKVLETCLHQSLASLNLPTRGDFTSLAERLTNIEMRLDDLDARLDELLRAERQRGTRKSKAKTEGNGS
jgi:hypothetical protein